MSDRAAIAEFKFGDRELVIQWDNEADEDDTGNVFVVREIEGLSACSVAGGSWAECCKFACTYIAAALREAGW